MGVLGQISNAKNSGHPGAYFDRHPRQGQHPHGRCVPALRRTAQVSNAVDFDNILLLTRDLLRDHADIREDYQNRFRYICATSTRTPTT